MRVYRISNLPEQLQTQEKFTEKKISKKKKKNRFIVGMSITTLHFPIRITSL